MGITSSSSGRGSGASSLVEGNSASRGKVYKGMKGGEVIPNLGTISENNDLPNSQILFQAGAGMIHSNGNESNYSQFNQLGYEPQRIQTSGLLIPSSVKGMFIRIFLAMHQ